MPTVSRIIANTYRDSVSLMQLSASLKDVAGVEEASAIMATEGNLALLAEVGLVDGGMTAQPSDLLVVVRARSEAAANAAIARVEEALKAKAPRRAAGGPAESVTPRSIGMAVEASPGVNLALVSVPGEYAAAEAEKALAFGLNVMLFSDNVSLTDEIALKRAAANRELLVMGPDCGTAIIDGVPLAFANRVRRGPIGCVAASGTGLQQVTSLVDRLGSGLSQAIGTGGRDLKEEVGGLTMLAGLDALASDRETKVIVLISKPPAAAVAEKVLAAAAKTKKPVVVCFVGASPSKLAGSNLHPVRTLEDAARAAVALARGRNPAKGGATPRLGKGVPRLARGQRFVRGLFSGGTFCYEASLLLGEALGQVWSNAPVRHDDELGDPFKSRGHTVIDLGEDVFTRGRPHPMIDHRLRNERMVREAGDPEVAVILFDVVLGYGSHPDPAAEMVPAIVAARAAAAKRKRRIAFVGAVCGTDTDPQGLARQEAALAKAGVILGSSNAEAVRIAAAIVKRAKA
ncbi:MAG TPA: acyl-CoA synthetase FdrA [Burkholderiales bacterium]|nr:acyl-CoA synthetase FdrA [Burkholderiales bacterium]